MTRPETPEVIAREALIGWMTLPTDLDWTQVRPGRAIQFVTGPHEDMVDLIASALACGVFIASPSRRVGRPAREVTLVVRIWANEGAQGRLVFDAAEVPLDVLSQVEGFRPTTPLTP